MTDVMLMSDPRVAAVPVRECDEPLVDIRGCSALRVDLRKQDPAGAFTLIRAGVLRRLEDAAGLLPQGMYLLAVESFRPLGLQVAYFEDYRNELRAQFPDWSPERLHAATSRHVSPPDVAPHTGGAAIDLTLCAEDGAELDLGTRVNASPEESADACYTHATNITPAARLNRTLLGKVLTASGLVNYPTEWWHWSLGDRYWAVLTGAPFAHYGPTAPAQPGGTLLTSTELGSMQ